MVIKVKPLHGVILAINPDDILGCYSQDNGDTVIWPHNTDDWFLVQDAPEHIWAKIEEAKKGVEDPTPCNYLFVHSFEGSEWKPWKS